MQKSILLIIALLIVSAFIIPDYLFQQESTPPQLDPWKIQIGIAAKVCKNHQYSDPNNFIGIIHPERTKFGMKVPNPPPPPHCYAEMFLQPIIKHEMPEMNRLTFDMIDIREVIDPKIMTWNIIIETDQCQSVRISFLGIPWPKQGQVYFKKNDKLIPINTRKQINLGEPKQRYQTYQLIWQLE